MADVQPEVEAEILVFNMADFTRGGVADAVNQRRGTNLSKTDVSNVVNDFEDDIRNADAPMQVAIRRLGRGMGASLGGDLAVMLAKDAYGQ